MTCDHQKVSLPARNESLIGFLRRLGDLNFYPDTASFMQSIGVGYGRPLVENIDALARLLGVPEDVLTAITPSAQSNGLLQWAYQRRTVDPICPKCVAEGRPHHQAWRHALVASCPIHDLMLQDQCPVCGQERTYRTGGWKTCGCGTLLSKFKEVSAPTIARVASRLISGAPIPDDAGALPPSFLGSEAIPDIARFLYFLATSAKPTRTGKDGKTPIPQTAYETTALLERAQDILLDWPHGFEALVNRRIEASRSEQPSMRAKLGRWHERLREFSAPAYQDFHAHIDKMSKQLVLSHDTAPLTAEVLPFEFSPVEDDVWITLEAGAAELGVARQRLLNLANQNRLHSRRIEGNTHQSVAVPKRLIDEAKAYQARFITRIDAMSYLGVSQKQFQLLVESTALKETPRELRPLLQNTLKFHKTDVVGLVAMARLQPNVQDGGATIPFTELNLQRTTDRAPILGLLLEIARGHIPSAPVSSEVPLGETHFCKHSIEEFMMQHQSSMSLSANEVAKMLGTKNECVAAWCNQGLLQSTSVKAGQHYRYSVKYENLLAFTNTFIPVATLADQLGTTSRSILKKLAENGTPVVGAFDVGNTSRGHLVRIIDLARSTANLA